MVVTELGVNSAHRFLPLEEDEILRQKLLYDVAQTWEDLRQALRHGGSGYLSGGGKDRKTLLGLQQARQYLAELEQTGMANALWRPDGSDAHKHGGGASIGMVGGGGGGGGGLLGLGRRKSSKEKAMGKGGSSVFGGSRKRSWLVRLAMYLNPLNWLLWIVEMVLGRPLFGAAGPNSRGTAAGANQKGLDFGDQNGSANIDAGLAAGAGQGAGQALDFSCQKFPRYAAGKLFLSSVSTSLLVGAFFNPSLPTLVSAFARAEVFVCNIPRRYLGKTLLDLLTDLLFLKGWMVLGLYRLALKREDVLDMARPENCLGSLEFCRKRRLAHELNATFRFLYTCPSAGDTIITQGDKVLCLGRGA